jgi:hypothetical protein
LIIVSADNISFKIPTDYIRDFKKNLYVEVNDYSIRIKKQIKPQGLHWLSIKQHQVNISLNARLLRENYRLGISLNSLDLLLSTLNNKCGLELDHGFITDTKVSNIHVKNDINGSINNLITELSIIGNSNKYNKVIRDNSVTYENTNKYDKLTTTIYGKQTEIIRNYSNKYKGLGISDSDYFNISRVETKCDDWRTVQKVFGTRNLAYILDQKNINYIQITNILKGQPMEINKPDISDFKTLSEYSNYCMVKDLNDRYNGDINAIKAYLKSKTKNTKHQYGILNKMLPIVKAPLNMTLNNVLNMKNQLKE